ncbi:MAG: hypothetical protein Fur0018_08530 [Anaerolineales bacterium]
MKPFSFLSVVLFLTACAVTAAPGPGPRATPRPTQTSEVPATSEVSPQAYILFSINVQDFSYPDLSAAVLTKILDLHEETGVPVDIYLTDQMAQIFADDYPALLARLRTSPVAAVSYHTRLPRPYSTYDWLGLKDLPPDELYDTIMRYETHAVDPVSGETTDAPGGYQGVADLLGYPPYAAAALSGDPDVSAAAVQVFADLGAQMTLTHGRALNLGDTKGGLPVRPEHAELKLFERLGEDAAQAFEPARSQALANAAGGTPPFLGVKMHDNDFFAAQSAWATVYSQDRRRPPWNPDLKAPLLSPQEQEAMWALYEATVRYVAAHPEAVTAVNLRGVLAMRP